MQLVRRLSGSVPIHLRTPTLPNAVEHVDNIALAQSLKRQEDDEEKDDGDDEGEKPVSKPEVV